MICFFVRHGAAVAPQDWQGSEFERPLTEKGRERMARVAKHLAKLGIKVDTILTSPLARAKQTAEIIAEEIDVAEPVVEDPRLAEGFDASRLANILLEHEEAGAVMLVGHEPTMSATLGRIIGGASLDFKKGAIACVELRDSRSPSGVLLWTAPPKVLSG